MNEIKFSVLMSIYYKEKSDNLKLALESLINQTLKPDEIVLVEDGALTKELDELIAFYENNYKFIKVLRLQKNVGLGNALNEGLKYCKYDYVARMDSDDISVENRFEKQISYLKFNKDVDALGGYIMEFDEISYNDISLRKVPLEQEDIEKYLIKRNPMNHVTVIFKKDSVIRVGGYKDCPYFEDYFLWSRMISNNMNLRNISDILVKVRAGLKMSNRRGNIKYIKHIINFENELLKLRLINIKEYIYNCIIRSIVSLLPNKLRYFLYQRRLRDEKN